MGRGRRRTAIPRQAGALHHPVPAGRADRYRRAARGGAPVARLERSSAGGQPAGQRRQHRHRAMRARAGRRLHHVHDLDRAKHLAGDLSQARLRPGARLRARNAARDVAEPAGRASVAAGEERPGADRLCEGQAGRAQLRLRRQRHQLAPPDGNVQPAGGHLHRARRLQRHGARHRRPALRPHRTRVQHGHRGSSLRAVGQAARARRVDARAAADAGRCADDRRIGLAGFRWRLLAGHRDARGHASRIRP